MESIFPFTDSFLRNDDATDSTESGTNEPEEAADSDTPAEPEDTADSDTQPAMDYITECGNYKKKHPKNGMFVYLNINSVRYKLEEIKPVCEKLDPLVLSLAETKIDESFKTGQFLLPGYHPPFRQDRNARGGGLLVYVRADIPCRKLSSETKQVETISLELILNKKKWGLIIAYKPPKVTNHDFLQEMEGL